MSPAEINLMNHEHWNKADKVIQRVLSFPTNFVGPLQHEGGLVQVMAEPRFFGPDGSPLKHQLFQGVWGEHQRATWWFQQHNYQHLRHRACVGTCCGADWAPVPRLCWGGQPKPWHFYAFVVWLYVWLRPKGKQRRKPRIVLWSLGWSIFFIKNLWWSYHVIPFIYIPFIWIMAISGQRRQNLFRIRWKSRSSSFAGLWDPTVEICQRRSSYP